MKKAATIGLALIAQLSFSAWQMKALAQDPMDTFASSSAGSGYDDDPVDTFAEFSSYPGPTLQGCTWGTVGSWRSPRHGHRYRPAPTQIPSDGMIYRGGHWQIEKDGTTTWIPDENADFEGDAFTGLQDNPPEKDPKEFDSNDAHDPPNPDPFVSKKTPYVVA
jgi:hypothetical protein